MMAFAELEPDELDGHQPRVVALDHRNRVTERIDYPPISLAAPSGKSPGGSIRTARERSPWPEESEPVNAGGG